MATALSNLAVLEVDELHAAVAVDPLSEALAIDQRAGDTWGVVLDQCNLAGAMMQADRTAEAWQLLRDHAGDVLDLADAELTVTVVELLSKSLAELGDAAAAAAVAGGVPGDAGPRRTTDRSPGRGDPGRLHRQGPRSARPRHLLGECEPRSRLYGRAGDHRSGGHALTGTDGGSRQLSVAVWEKRDFRPCGATDRQGSLGAGQFARIGDPSCRMVKSFHGRRIPSR